MRGTETRISPISANHRWMDGHEFHQLARTTDGRVDTNFTYWHEPQMNADGHGCSTTKGRKGRKGRKGLRRFGVSGRGDGCLDRIAEAFAREREHARVGAPERETVWAHVFRCVCCGRLRGDQERRDGRSMVCIRCVREAGYWN
jgi:hypothetical protein